MPVERLGEHSEELRSRTWTRDEAVDARNARLGEFGEIRLPDMSERHHHGPET